jgi:hypothetical protein
MPHRSTTSPRRVRRMFGALSLLVLASACSQQDATQAETEAPPAAQTLALPLSLLDVMRASVEIPANGIWDAQVAETLTDNDWLLVDQDAADLAASATLMSMPGAGQSDAAWVANADWQEWSADIQKTALALRAAAKVKDQQALFDGADRLLETCTACHEKYRPESPSDGVARYPFYPKRSLPK